MRVDNSIQSNNKKVSCIIPVYNEQAGISNVLKVAAAHPLIDEVIVVDDGSTDNTRRNVSVFKNIRLIAHKKNKGKSAAVHIGIIESLGEFIMFLDADLVGLTQENITDLLTPVLTGRADISISLRQNSPRLWKIIGLDYISGERVFRKRMLTDHLHEIMALPGFGLEVFLNKLIVQNRYSIEVVMWQNVASPYKYKKSGLLAGIVGDIRMIMHIFKVVSPIEPVYQIVSMLRLRVRNNSSTTHYKISLIIPAYNEENYIGACLRHAIRHSGDKIFEIIVIDNASTDRTSKIARQFKDIRVIFEKEKGLTRARQRGLEEARGDLLAYIDADTRMPAGWINTVQKKFSDNEKMVSLSGPYRYYDGSRLKRIVLASLWRISAPITYHAVGYMILGGNFVAKRKALLNIGGFNPNIEFYGEDTDIARRLSKIGKVVFCMNFYIYSSCRRFSSEGIIKTSALYALNFIWGVLFHKPFLYTHRDIRLKNDTTGEKICE